MISPQPSARAIRLPTGGTPKRSAKPHPATRRPSRWAASP